MLITNDLDFKTSWTTACDTKKSFITIDTTQSTSEMMKNSANGQETDIWPKKKEACTTPIPSVE